MSSSTLPLLHGQRSSSLSSDGVHDDNDSSSGHLDVTPSLKRFFPLLMGILLPISTFLNIQAIAVPGWISISKAVDDDGYGLLRPHHPVDTVVYYTPPWVTIFSLVSLLFGLLGSVSLFIRMLEKKLKWTTRLIIFSSFCQGITAIMISILFILFAKAPAPDANYSYTEGFGCSLASGVSSLVVAMAMVWQQHLNRNQNYVYVVHELSPSQRQLSLLTMVSIAYTVFGGMLYGHLEGWDFDDAMYWTVTTLTTIGFGDFYPKTVYGIAFFPIFASFGMLLVGANIFSIRQVVLELLTHQLASQLAKKFGVSQEVQWGESNLSSPSLHGQDPQRRQPSHERIGRSSMRIPRSRSWDDQSRSRSPHPGSEAIHAPLKLERSRTTSALELQKRATITRFGADSNFPTLTIVAGDLHHDDVIKETRRTVIVQVYVAVALVAANIFGFGYIYSNLEGWSYLEGIYFSFCSLATIGFGDFVPSTIHSRTIFIWYIFIGIGSMTYLGSMVGELALNQWVVEINRIENRMDRYEKKALLKRLYKKEKKHRRPETETSEAESEDSDADFRISVGRSRLGNHEAAVLDTNPIQQALEGNPDAVISLDNPRPAPGQRAAAAVAGTHRNYRTLDDRRVASGPATHSSNESHHGADADTASRGVVRVRLPTSRRSSGIFGSLQDSHIDVSFANREHGTGVRGREPPRDEAGDLA
ncbi:uncharacterized protein BJ171DRAFT_484938 [Polychytrium aggregatum]|uniref:uncharacterized protein n=1 Tax=Polychytrium aggregatum TaxID=110093 RepID=UPI0022FECA06|nr:uncharacterized protein BJ171DRAFT_484938 [Polychytrium aggregatum]KAI9209764.1 hypothetical protein BJ171DRAFT_484938 [Polychytrium aggregatum]